MYELNINRCLIDLGYLKEKLQVGAFICDSPARTFLCGIVDHDAFNGCSKCRKLGSTHLRTIIFTAQSDRSCMTIELRLYDIHNLIIIC